MCPATRPSISATSDTARALSARRVSTIRVSSFPSPGYLANALRSTVQMASMSSGPSSRIHIGAFSFACGRPALRGGCRGPPYGRGGECRVMPAVPRTETAAPARARPSATSQLDRGGRSVAEVTHAGEHHGDAVLVGRGDHLGVAHRAARLDHRLDARGRGGIDAVAE